MADERQAHNESKEAEPGETHPPPMTSEQFENAPEFRKLKRGMKKLLRVSKAELDERARLAKEASPRIGNPKAPGRKPVA